MIVAVVLSRSLGGKGRSASSPNDVVRSRKEVNQIQRKIVSWNRIKTWHTVRIEVKSASSQDFPRSWRLPELERGTYWYLTFLQSAILYCIPVRNTPDAARFHHKLVARYSSARTCTIEWKFGENLQPCMRKGVILNVCFRARI
jgi:hypothetical protein